MPFNTDRTPVPGLSGLESACNRSTRLPSLDEFDQGVEALRYHSVQVPSWTSPHPNATRRPVVPLPSIQARGSPVAYVAQAYPTQMISSPHEHGDPLMRAHKDRSSVSPDGETGHNNQRYTTEEGDFIIYCFHDKQLKWKRIQEDFTSVFKSTRTVQGLQAWYYRMNQRIPLWDVDGRLIFACEKDLEPKHTSFQRRKCYCHGRAMELLGLAQRYPERAIGYEWVDPDIKRRCYDWAAKRTMQYRERQERREKDGCPRLYRP